MRPWHRHEWRWDAEHRHENVYWHIEACGCGKRRKGFWMLRTLDSQSDFKVFEYPTSWSVA